MRKKEIGDSKREESLEHSWGGRRIRELLIIVTDRGVSLLMRESRFEDQPEFARLQEKLDELKNVS